MDDQALPGLALGEGADRRIMGMVRQRPDRQADWGDDLNLDVVALGERARLPLDEAAEGRACFVGKQGGEGQDAQHGCPHSIIGADAGLRLRH